MIRHLPIWFAALLTLLTGTGSVTVLSPLVESWQVRSSSSLKVNGKTNINSFNCVIGAYNRTDTLEVIKPQHLNGECKADGKLVIPIERFDCHHKVMTKDLQKTLKSSQFPEMTIKFLTFSRSIDGLPSGSKVTARADISLAGARKTYDIDFEIKQYTQKQIELLGIKPLLFSDFGLTPPSKLGGTIKVKNELAVEIKLQLTRI